MLGLFCCFVFVLPLSQTSKLLPTDLPSFTPMSLPGLCFLYVVPLLSSGFLFIFFFRLVMWHRFATPTVSGRCRLHVRCNKWIGQEGRQRTDAAIRKTVRSLPSNLPCPFSCRKEDAIAFCFCFASSATWSASSTSVKLLETVAVPLVNKW